MIIEVINYKCPICNVEYTDKKQAEDCYDYCLELIKKKSIIENIDSEIQTLRSKKKSLIKGLINYEYVGKSNITDIIEDASENKLRLAHMRALLENCIKEDMKNSKYIMRKIINIINSIDVKESVQND